MSTIQGRFCLWIQTPRSTSGSNRILASPPCWWLGGRMSEDSFVRTAGYLLPLWTGRVLSRAAVNQKTARSKCLWIKQELILFWLHSTSLRLWDFTAARGSWEYTAQTQGIDWCIQRLPGALLSSGPGGDSVCVPVHVCVHVCMCVPLCVRKKKQECRNTAERQTASAGSKTVNPENRVWI